MSSVAECTLSEMMVIASARAIADAHVCFVGIGLPNIACNLAKRLVNPRLRLLYESGIYDAHPNRLPLSIGDPVLVTGSTAVMSMFEVFSYMLQGGNVDVGFLGGAQIDRFGNLNTTIIGDYEQPSVRLPGAGGATEIWANAARVLVVMRQSRRSFVPRVDFRTNGSEKPPTLDGATNGVAPRRPALVVTDLGTYDFDDETGEMRVASVHPGVSLEDVQSRTSWEILCGHDVGTTPPPTEAEIRCLRDELGQDAGEL